MTTVGVEEELLVIDAAGDLVPRAKELLVATPDALDERVVAELSRCQVETTSRVCDDLDDLSAELVRLRSAVVDVGRPLGLRALAVASHPWAAWDDQSVNTDTAHYRRLLATFQQVARETVICGCHVHVGIEDPDDRIVAMNGVAAWLPVLLALSANSPWWQGADTGYASYRALVWGAWPMATMPPPLPDMAAFDRLAGELQAVGAVEDASGIHWWARPSHTWPTLEFRVTDVCLRAEDAVVVAGLARALTETALRRRDAMGDRPPAAMLDAGLWRAARHGLDERLVDPRAAELRPAAEVVAALLDHVADALVAAGDAERVHEGVSRILAEGNGAARQRDVLARCGDDRVAAFAELALLGSPGR